jgi:L-lactate utilization protein LutB
VRNQQDYTRNNPSQAVMGDKLREQLTGNSINDYTLALSGSNAIWADTGMQIHINNNYVSLK